VEKPALRPRARLDGGGLVDTQLAYIPELASNGTGNGAEPARAEEQAAVDEQ
jgi:hypothetical protein